MIHATAKTVQDRQLIVIMIALALVVPRCSPFLFQRKSVGRLSSRSFVSPTTSATTGSGDSHSEKGKLIVLGGTGYLGQAVCQRAALEGYTVVSLSRRGLPANNAAGLPASAFSSKIDYRRGDVRQKECVVNVLREGGYTGVIHCIGLLFDDASGLGSYNRFVSGSGSLPDSESTYDTITRLTAFNAIDATMEFAIANQLDQPLPFCFTSAAEAGWPDVAGGVFIESIMPDFIKRYMAAKRAVEAKLMASGATLRPIIVRPSLIFSMDRPASLPSVGLFALFSKIGVPFVDRPVTVVSLASAMVRAIGKETVQGILRYPQIDDLSA